LDQFTQEFSQDTDELAYNQEIILLGIGEIMKIKILLFILALASTYVYAYANPGCIEHTKAMENKRDNDINARKGQYKNEDTAVSAVSPKMGQCIRISKNQLKFLYGKNKQSIIWEDYTNATPKCIQANAACISEQDQDKKDSLITACNEIKKLAAECDAAAYLISAFERDWENPDHAKTDTIKSAGAPAISCKGRGVETLDYEGCVKFVENGLILEEVQKQVYKGQELIYADKAMSAQADVAKNGNAATGSLEALRGQVKSQQELMNQRAGIDSGKLAILANYYSEMPTSADLSAKCANYKPQSTLPDSEYSQDPIKACRQAVATDGFAFLQNQNARNQMKAKLVQVGGEIGVDLLNASLLAKQAGNIGNAIAKIDAFKPIDPVMPATENIQTSNKSSTKNESASFRKI